MNLNLKFQFTRPCRRDWVKSSLFPTIFRFQSTPPRGARYFEKYGIDESRLFQSTRP